MTYNDFKNEIMKQVSLLLPQAKLDIKPFTKNNGIILDGLVILDPKLNIAPTIYLNEYFAMFLDEKATIQEITEMIVSCFERSCPKNDFDVSFFEDFDKIKDKLIFRLVNRETNEELLKDAVHVDYLDLAIVFYCYLSIDGLDDTEGVICIKNEYLKIWDKTPEDIYMHAMENTPKLLGLNVKNMEEFLLERMGEENFNNQFPGPMTFAPFYIATNEKMVNGASVLIYKDLLKALASKAKADLYIIPCSIHELIILSANSTGEMKVNDIKDMITYVNSHEVELRDFLSDNLYFYSREEEKLSIA